MEAAANGNRLFPEFEPASAQEWEAAIKASLKGADYHKALFRKSYEGIETQPFYTQANLSSAALPDAEPGQFPYVRGRNTRQNSWQNCPAIKVKSASQAAAKVREALAKGATSAELPLANAAETDISALLAEDFGEATLLLHQPQNPAALLAQLKNRQPKGHTRFIISYSPFTLTNQPESASALQKFIELHREAPEICPVTVNGAEFYNAGGTLVQELAFTLSTITELVHRLTEAGLSADEAFTNVHVRMAVGTNYFFEIAKLRALRLLFAALVKAFNASATSAENLRIQSVTAAWHQTLADPYNNLLRATTEAMSAVIGGTDYLTVLPHSSETGASTEFSERIARNISTILREEAYLANAIDPAAGAYYLESLTEQLADAAWALFQQIEAQGGYSVAVGNGFINAELEKSREKKQANLATRRELLIGTNQFANLAEQFTESAVEKANSSTTTKASTQFDQLRLRTISYSRQQSKAPHVHLLMLGSSSMRKVRADFAQDFFALAGFEAVRVDLKDQAEMPDALADARCVVLCAADEDYAQYVDTIADSLKATGNCNLVLLAGNPALLPGLPLSGIDGFVYTGANAVEVLTTFQLRLGIV